MMSTPSTWTGRAGVLARAAPAPTAILGRRFGPRRRHVSCSISYGLPARGHTVPPASNDYLALIGGTLADPYPEYTRLRSDDPVHWSEPVSSWILTRHRDVAAALQYDPRI